MTNGLVILSPGFEEIEAVTIIDLLRRADIDITTAGLQPDVITGSHQIIVKPDKFYRDCRPDDYDILIFPGGQPGTNNMKKDELILSWIKDRFRSGKLMAAICAAPTLFHEAGVSKNLKLTSYPSEKELFKSSRYVTNAVVKDKNVITSRGVGTAIDFSLAIIKELKDKKTAREISRKILYE
jgi:4-methyl-5(b-hydroxyethyl)-thiazole monophosphate biosynthesis